MLSEHDLKAFVEGDTCRYPLVLDAFCRTLWAILPAKLAVIQAILLARCRGEKATAAEIEAARPEPPPPRPKGKVAVIPIMGTISQRPSVFTSGGTSTETAGRLLDAAVADPEIKAVALHIDSPGGSVYGVPELAAKIRAAKHEKKIVAVANSVAASAAYWLASQATELVVTPGGQVGSIGVIAAHEDVSKSQEMDGVKTTVVSAGKYKSEGHPFEPLSEEARAFLQSEVDRYYEMFTADVARGRGRRQDTVKSGFGQGRMVGADAAVAEGMADRVATWEDTLRRLGADVSTLARTSAEVRLAEMS